MKNSKRTAVLLAAALTVMQTGALARILPDDVAGTRFEKPVQLLSALGIMVGDDDGAFRLDDTIKRSEAAKMAVHAMGLEASAEAARGQSKFPDVGTDHWANGYINVATAQGLFIGDDEGNFRPNDTITYAEVVTMFVRATGYRIMAEEEGDFPDGYMSVAISNKMTKNVEGSANEPITRGNVAYLANNALTVNLMERTGYGSDKTYEITDKTLLKDKLNVTKAAGQITAVEHTGIDSEASLSENQIKIGDEIYSTAYNMNNLLGYNVEYYVREDSSGEETVILALPQEGKNSSVTIEADLFEKITEKSGKKAIEYFTSEGSSAIASALLEEDARLIYNGKYEELTDELISLSGKSGSLVLLDTDKNSLYDLVFVTEYTNMVVEQVTSSNKIIDKYNAPTLNLGEDEEVKYRITRGLQEIKPKELNEYDVLSIAASKDKKLYEITVTNTKIEGKVTGSGSNGYTIGGKKYKLAANYPGELEIGTEGIFYLDIQGKIAASDTTAAVSDNYAYLIKAYYSEDTEESSFKVLGRDGAEKTYTANEKIRFNGVSGQLSEEVVKKLSSDGKTSRQLITLTTNTSGKITAISTAADNTESGAYSKNKFTLDYKLTDAEYNEKLSKLGSVVIDDSTVIFDILEEENEYSLASRDMLKDGQKYNALIFDRTEDFRAGAVIITDAQLRANADASIAVVDSISEASKENDEITERLYAYQDGKQLEINASESGVLVKNGGEALEQGDIIQYTTNAKGEITKVNVLLNISEKSTEFTSSPAEKLSLVYGKAAKKFSGSVNVTVNDGSTVNYVLPSDITVYSVDTTKSKNNIKTASVGDIQAFDSDEQNRLFLKIYDGEVQEAVIVK